jgi:protocatechuate 3,4-dioxygenase, alpha subunit
MNAEHRLIPTSSQTVGPYFRIGLEYLIASAPDADPATAVTIHGSVLDRDGAPVPDAMLEFWSSGYESGSDAFPQGFRRVATDTDGSFSVTMQRPRQQEGLQAPHLIVLIFARGLLRHLISRVYFEHEAANAADTILLSVPAERRSTLIARSDGPTSFRWDVILQGTDETVFFSW